MLPQKQLCLAKNRLGMQCRCQALSGGRCHFHSPLLSSGSVIRRSPRGELTASFGVWRDLFAGHAAGVRRSGAPLLA